jgi:hypothetical protein
MKLELLKSIHLPGNCKCGHPACDSTWDFRLTHEQRDILQLLLLRAIEETEDNLREAHLDQDIYT